MSITFDARDSNAGLLILVKNGCARHSSTVGLIYGLNETIFLIRSMASLLAWGYLSEILGTVYLSWNSVIYALADLSVTKLISSNEGDPSTFTIAPN